MTTPQRFTEESLTQMFRDGNDEPGARPGSSSCYLPSGDIATRTLFGTPPMFAM